MFAVFSMTGQPWRERMRSSAGRRAAGFALALLAELLLALLLLTLAPPAARRREPVETKVFSFAPTPEAPAPNPPTPNPPTPVAPRHRSAASIAPPAPTPAAIARAAPRPAEPAPAAAPAPAAPTPMILLSPEQMAAADLSALPRSAAAPAARRAAGPPNIANPSDTPRVEGTGPHGEPLYAAAWYREPYDSELRGYLSTATGPGWALIACRTVADFRVDDCVALDEYPEHSQIARAVLAAAWQFRVRPPIRNDQYMVGEWVRIRIDYEQRREPPARDRPR